jgi:hypothetical protein
MEQIHRQKEAEEVWKDHPLFESVPVKKLMAKGIEDILFNMDPNREVVISIPNFPDIHGTTMEEACEKALKILDAKN